MERSGANGGVVTAGVAKKRTSADSSVEAAIEAVVLRRERGGTDSSIKLAGGIAKERVPTIGGVAVAADVAEKRERSSGCVAGACRIAK